MCRMRWLFAVVVFCACGDNSASRGDPLTPHDELVVVAHQDDDLYFMQPDLLEAIQSGRGITSIFVTAGDDQHGPDAPDLRYEGLRYAYGAAAGSNDWRCGYITIAGHEVQHCRLFDRPVSLVFLAYPDGGVNGEFPQSLLKLWEGKIADATTVAHETTQYTRDGLIDTIADVVRRTHPRTIRTLEIGSMHGHDHVDHMIVGAACLLAMARAQSRAELLSYRGYSTLTEAPNKLPLVLQATADMVGYYEACSSKCAACGSVCKAIDPNHVAWFSRRYAVGFRRFAHGRLGSNGACLSEDLTTGPCEAAPTWRFDDGALRLRDKCVDVDATGSVRLAPCADVISQRFFVDDEGHIWSAIVPTPQVNMDYAHLTCLGLSTAGIRAQLCGGDPGAPSWTFSPATVSTPHDAFGISSFASVRLGDIDGDGYADLCVVEEERLKCASGNGAGAFLGPSTERFMLKIDPSTLSLGDIDNDGRIDACGSDGTSIVCATSGNSYATTSWSSPLVSGSSFATVDGYVCGHDSGGVQCVSPTPTPTSPTRTLTAWPTVAAVTWTADLDGDGQPDWCAGSPSGIGCAVAAESSLSTDGAPWSFSVGGSLDESPTSSTDIADIDGDLRADLCSLDGTAVQCARSQGRGFGPRVTFATFSSVPRALWLADLDGDGRADACVDSDTSVDCDAP